MPFVKPQDAVLHYQFCVGAPERRPVVFSNSLGTDLRIWDDVIDRLPAGTSCLRMDKRGHGLSDTGAIDMATHVADLADLMDHLGLRDALVCGVSVGGMIAQGLAARRPDLVAGLILSNTAARIGTPEMWGTRIEAVKRDGLAGMADDILVRWFTPAFRTERAEAHAGYRNMLIRTPADGYAGTCRAIRDTDFTQATQALAVPTLCIAGSEDGSTPPDIVRGLSDLIDGAAYHCIDGVGHLPCIEAPDAMADLIRDFHERLA